MRVVIEDKKRFVDALRSVGSVARTRANYFYWRVGAVGESVVFDVADDGTTLTMTDGLHVVMQDLPDVVYPDAFRAVAVYPALKKLVCGASYGREVSEREIGATNLLPFENVEEVVKFAPCFKCDGKGYLRCEKCDNGPRKKMRCYRCSRTGQIRCATCEGKGGETYTVHMLGDKQLTGMAKPRKYQAARSKQEGLVALDGALVLDFSDEEVIGVSIGDFSASLKIKLSAPDYPELPDMDDAAWTGDASTIEGARPETLKRAKQLFKQKGVGWKYARTDACILLRQGPITLMEILPRY